VSTTAVERRRPAQHSQGPAPRRGRPPDEERRRLIARLRAQGWTFQQIGERLGTSRQSVHGVLKASGTSVEPPGLACTECHRDVASRRLANRPNGPVLCPACLARHPEVSFSQRLKCLRLAAGLTQAGLGRRAGLQPMLIAKYEQGKAEPQWRNLAKLIRILGVRLVAIDS
jgi:transcriptional regulator with XRE-family HTH domain